MTARFVPVELKVEVSHLPANERLALRHLVEAAKIFDAVFLRQVSPLNTTYLAELVRAHLVSEHRSGWFSFHDLLRAYAGELARMNDDTGCRRAALHRLVDHYAHGAVAVGRALAPGREPIELATPQPGSVLPADIGTDVDAEAPARALAWVGMPR